MQRENEIWEQSWMSILHSSIIKKSREKERWKKCRQILVQFENWDCVTFCLKGGLWDAKLKLRNIFPSSVIKCLKLVIYFIPTKYYLRTSVWAFMQLYKYYVVFLISNYIFRYNWINYLPIFEKICKGKRKTNIVK